MDEKSQYRASLPPHLIPERRLLDLAGKMTLEEHTPRPRVDCSAATVMGWSWASPILISGSSPRMNEQIFWQFVKTWDEFEAIERAAQGSPNDYIEKYQKVRQKMRKLRCDLEDHEPEEVRS